MDHRHCWWVGARPDRLGGAVGGRQLLILDHAFIPKDVW